MRLAAPTTARSTTPTGQAATSAPGAGTGRSLSSYHDDALMLRARQGDREAFEVLVTRHSDMVLGLARRALSDSSGSRAVAEETFLDLWRNRHRQHPEGKLRARLARSTLERCRARGLPDEDLGILAMRYGVEMRFDEIAEAMGRPAENLRSRAYRALCTMRSRIAGPPSAPESPPTAARGREEAVS